VRDFERHLITQWRSLELPAAGVTVVVGVSGGADSLSLLLALHSLRKQEKLAIRIVAAHFNHGIRGGESDDDEEFVRSITSRLGVELAVGHAHGLTRGADVEQRARAARYEFLARIAENVKAFAVLTAHTMNDQAETFLMNLLRGSGPRGLQGIKPKRLFTREYGADRKRTAENILLIRPLIGWAKRLDTEAFCHECDVAYRYDSMNEDTAYRRVHIRKILMPLLADINPNIIETLSRTALLMQGLPLPHIPWADEDEPLIAPLREMSENERLDAVRVWLEARRDSTRSLGLKHVQAVVSLALSEKSGRRAELPGGFSVVRSRGRLIFKRK